MKLLSGFVNSVPICTIYNKDKTLSPCVVVPPERTDLVLTTDILEEEGEREREREREKERKRETSKEDPFQTGSYKGFHQWDDQTQDMPNRA